MKLLLLASTIATLAACPSAPRAILTDQTQAGAYRYTAVNTKSDQAKTIDTQLAREQIVTRYATGDRTAYVVNDRAATKQQFQSLDKAVLVVHLSRVSDINGWGVAVNGEVHRATTVKLEFPKARLAEAFTLLQKLETAPLETIASVWPTSLAAIQSTKRVGWFETGYVVDVDARLLTGNPFDADTQVTLYRTQKRSGYFNL
jgi:hypothetical protein